MFRCCGRPVESSFLNWILNVAGVLGAGWHNNIEAPVVSSPPVRQGRKEFNVQQLADKKDVYFNKQYAKEGELSKSLRLYVGGDGLMIFDDQQPVDTFTYDELQTWEFDKATKQLQIERATLFQILNGAKVTWEAP